MALFTALLCVVFAVQDDDDQLTPAQVREMLHDIRSLMTKAEEFLNDSSRGGSSDSDLGPILDRIKKLTARTEKKQKDAIDQLARLIQQAKAGGSATSKKPPTNDGRSGGKPGTGAVGPYDATRNGQPESIFRSKGDHKGWGDLPARIRDAMLTGRRDSDEYPPEFAELLKEYYERFND